VSAKAEAPLRGPAGAEEAGGEVALGEEGGEEASVEPLIVAEQVRALFRNRRLPYLVGVANAVIVVAALGGDVSLVARVAWLAVIGALAAGRLVLARAYLRVQPLPADAPRWGRRFAIGIGMNGVAWGAMPIVFSAGRLVEERALMSFVLGGMVAGATASASTDQRSFRAFVIPTLVPMLLMMAAVGGRVNLAMALMLALFGVAMAILASGSGRAFERNARLSLRNERLAQRLAEARDLLEQRVLERTAALRASMEDLRRAEANALHAVAARDEFLAVASHELLTPLAALQLHLRVLEQNVAGVAGGERATASLATMSRQVTRIAALVDTVFRVSGLDRGQLVLEARPIDLAATIRAAVGDLESAGLIDSLAGAVTLRLEEPMNGRWDPTRVEQIVVNLLTNAIKYGGGNPVTVALGVDSRDEGRVVLSVSDQGCGIPASDLDAIFEKFHRGDAGRRSRGLGLGLFVVRELVRAMGGEVSVSSTEGVGSSFRVVLPGRLTVPRAEASRVDA